MSRMQTLPDWDLSAHFALDPTLTFLNHGSFGACPRPILEEQARYRSALEANPMRFFLRDLVPHLDRNRQALATFTGCAPEDLVFVNNTTTGINAILRSLRFVPGDEILTTNMGYLGVNNAVANTARQTGARVVSVTLPFPDPEDDAIVAAIMAGITPATRLCVVDHICSPTAFILPLERIVSAVEAAGVPCVVDGAHAVGQVDLQLDRLGASYYVSNCHKWLCTPKGSAFLHVRRDRQDGLHPLTVSLGYSAGGKLRPRLWEEFDWQGTQDPTAVCCIAGSIAWFEQNVPGGWPALRQRNRKIALEVREHLCNTLRVPSLCSENFVGSMAIVPLPGPVKDPILIGGVLKVDPLYDALCQRGFAVYLSYFPAHPQRHLRISVQAYNTFEQYRQLGLALQELL
jgi:isopenicillin-N epimerase